MALLGIPIRDLALPALLLLWIVLMRVVLPKLGVPT